ncbi:hypothetical protein [Streptomyces rubiginosohelvolus]|uniref:hypothetical protein n=1 Tax=Streptomyces rubiginosohelvolus TaxID=67362 RepID=UPI0036A7C8B8
MTEMLLRRSVTTENAERAHRRDDEGSRDDADEQARTVGEAELGECRLAALEELGTPQEQREHFVALDMRVTERIGELADQMLLKVPMQERVGARAAVRA